VRSPQALLLIALASCAHAGPAQPSAEPVAAAEPPPRPSAPAPAPAPLQPQPPPPLPPEATHRLDFRRGEPVISVGLMEGKKEIAFSPRGLLRARIFSAVEKVVEAPPGGGWRVRVTASQPAHFTARVQLAELQFEDKQGLASAQALWVERGVEVRPQILGSVFGIAGKVIDNRRYLLLTARAQEEDQARATQRELLERFGARTSLFLEINRPAQAVVELVGPDGAVVAVSQDRVILETPDGGGFDVRQVEYGVGYDFHGFQDRSYRGALQVGVDRLGALALVNVVRLEDHLKGLVPSEIFARAPAEALKAQAVTARGEVLAKVGTKHLSDPYLLCAEQHCAVYKGRTGEVASTNAAVDATRGEALFSVSGRLVDSVYSAVCGGHTEDNEHVWGGVANSSLRGRPDLLSTQGRAPSPKQLPAFLSAELPTACRLSSFAQPSKYRWERRFTAAEVQTLTAHLDLGPVHAMAVSDRGVSGRARVLTLSGERRATQVRGELNIRRLFKMLNSSMFELTAERDARGRVTGWVFRGGGWGHGVGMCQTGAIGRAEAGHDYRAILDHYYSGAQPAAIY
jgi:stage II sporulation protein D